MREPAVIFATAPLRAGARGPPGRHVVVLDPWIDQKPLRINDEEKLAARAAELGATVLIKAWPVNGTVVRIRSR